VPGLRREEVAQLAAISPEYYLRLEQGRDTSPSSQVLHGLARALRLDDASTVYLHLLAHSAPPAQPSSSDPESVSPGVRTLINGWPTTAATVYGQRLTVLAANPLAIALSPFFAPGVAHLRAIFVEPEMRLFYRDWDQMTARCVPWLRAAVGAFPTNPHLVALLRELTERSERFRELWDRHDVLYDGSTPVRLLHREAGRLDLRCEVLTVSGKAQTIITYHATPGSESLRRLEELARRQLGTC
jgi:hypothetical protein